MNKDIIRKIFPEEVSRVESKHCPICNKDMTSAQFKDKLSIREYKISGMCQECQDDTFSED